MTTQTLRVLVVEDELIVALLIEDMVRELGYEVAVVSRMDDAARMLDDCDLAVLDVHLNGRQVFPLADRLAARKIPFLFTTGYGRKKIPSGHAARPLLQKPFRQEDLRRALERLRA